MPIRFPWLLGRAAAFQQAGPIHRRRKGDQYCPPAKRAEGVSQPRECWRTDLVSLGVSRLDLGPNLAAPTQVLCSRNRERGAWHEFKSIVLPGLGSNRHHIVRMLLICKYTDTSELFVQLEKWQNAKQALLSPRLDILSEKLFSLWCAPSPGLTSLSHITL